VATFKPGQSGNPAGKPKGTQHKLTRLKNALAANRVRYRLSETRIPAWRDFVSRRLGACLRAA
jgi:hypothetical protein